MEKKTTGNTHGLRVYTDGAIRPERGESGLAAILREETGQIRAWWSCKAGALTCNEAEYAAAIFALEQLQQLPAAERPGEVVLYSDSRVLVDQMNGRAAAHAPALRQAARRLRALAARFRRVSFHHIPREHNRLADALAFDVLAEGEQANRPATAERPHRDTWEQLVQLWRKS